MQRLEQTGMLSGTAGVMMAVTGLFPSLTGQVTVGGIGALQLVTMLAGLSLLIFGALLYVKAAFYPRARATFAQQIAVRLSLTALLIAGMASAADVLGFGSNVHALYAEDIYFGPLQAAGLIGGFAVAASGVLLYALGGMRGQNQKDDNDPTSSS
ncbi:MAG: hypothetical protein OXG07_13345 [Anaerolineaceae bacterium]|nr:hypothetical protein [Anaerolineaceae bacterium]MCY3907083.1 hypothetical protein [Anaerolineaceae bacterium]